MSDPKISTDELKKIELFAALGSDILAKISAIIETQTYRDSNEIFAEGSLGDSLYIVVSGEVVIRKQLKSHALTYKDLAYMGPGDFFGELSLIDNLQRSAQAAAKGDVVLYKISKQDFQRLIAASPEAAVEQLLGFLRAMGNRIRASNGHLLAIYEIGMLITKEKNMDLVLINMLRQIISIAGSDVSGAAVVWNRYNREYELKCKTGFLPPELYEQKIFEKGVFSEKLLNIREVSIISDIPEYTGGGLKLPGGMLVSPFFDKTGLLIGFFILYSSVKNAFNLNHKLVISAVSSLASLGIINAWHQEEEDSLKLMNKNKRYTDW